MSLTDFEKGQIVAYRDCGLTYDQISKKINRPASTISGFYAQFQKDGRIERKQGSGRKRKTTELEDRDILITAKKRRKITAKEIKNEFNLPVTERTICNRLNEFGFHSFFTVKKPFISEQNQQSRLAFAKEYKDKPVQFWRSVLWSDESQFVLRFQGRERVWRLPNERYAPYCLHGTVKHDKKINVWGCFAAHGVGKLYRVNGNLEQNQFHSILVHQMIPSARALFPDGNFVFQQDNDPKHTATKNQEYLKNKNIQVLNWPSQSPDLNPIENLWSCMDREMKNRNPQNEDQLFAIVKERWESLTTDLLTSLVESMPRRCAAVIQSKGMPTKY